jgi:acyl carrier protein
MDVYEDIRKLVEVHLGDLCPPTGIGLDDNLWDLGMDSMKSVAIVLAVEDKLGVELSDEMMNRDNFSSVRRIADMVVALAAENSGGPS